MAEKIRDVMTKEPATVTADDTALDAAKAMRDGDFGAIVVVNDGGEALGTSTTATSSCAAVADGPYPGERKASEVFTTEPTSQPPRTTASTTPSTRCARRTCAGCRWSRRRTCDRDRLDRRPGRGA